MIRSAAPPARAGRRRRRGAARAEIEIVPVTSPGGIEAWLYEDHTIPILTIEASFLGGPALDAEGREGTTYMMAALARRKARATSMPPPSPPPARCSPPGSASGRSDDDVSVSATMLTETRDATVELLRLALTEPRFDPEAVERLRAQALASIRMAEGDPGTLAGQALYATTFPDHPYGRPDRGYAGDRSTAISVEDLRAAHAASLTRDRLRVAVVGAIGPDELGPLLDRLFGGLPADRPRAPADGRAGPVRRDDRDRPRHPAVGGRLRERRAPPRRPRLHPGVGDGLHPRWRRLRLAADRARCARSAASPMASIPISRQGSLGGLYMGSFSSSNERVADALEILRAEWARMAEERRDRGRALRGQALSDGRILRCGSKETQTSPRSCLGCRSPGSGSTT